MQPRPLPARRTALTALAFASALLVAPAVGAEGIPTHPARDKDRGQQEERDEPVSAVRVSGSGAVAAVQVCDGETQVATIAGGNDAFGILNAVGGGCDDADDANGALTVAGSGALAAASEGAAVTLPAGGAAALPSLAAQAAAGTGGGGGGGGNAPAAAPADGGGQAAANGGGGGGGREGRAGRAARGAREVRGDGQRDRAGRAARADRADRGDRTNREGREDRTRRGRGGQVSALADAGVGPFGAPLDIVGAVAAALASVTSAGLGYRARRR